MGRKKKTGLGKSIIKDHRASRRHDKATDSWRHTSELNDGYDWGRLNLQSVTEQSALDDFLATAELAGTEFTAEKANVTFVTSMTNEAIMTAEDIAAIKTAQNENKVLLRIPRRPRWDENTSADELNLRERDSFLEWRKNLAKLQEKKHILLTPFEANLEVWRQLWRVIERSDVIVQIVDARNPLLFYCADLEVYVKEVDPLKSTLVLVNKADLLTPKQRLMWSEYFKSQGAQAVFWSAIEESRRCESENAVVSELNNQDEHDNDSESDTEETTPNKLTFSQASLNEDNNDLEEDIQRLKISENIASESNMTEGSVDNCQSLNESQHNVTKGLQFSLSEPQSSSDKCVDLPCKNPFKSMNPEDGAVSEADYKKELPTSYGSSDIKENENFEQINLSNSESSSEQEDTCKNMHNQCQNVSTKPGEDFGTDSLLTGEKLLDVFKMLHQKQLTEKEESLKTNRTTVGLVGYPNVGKSSSINAILQSKKVSVSATPGKTKHFQTLLVDDELCLCDCPGLVFPSFVSTKAEMVVNGILPIDQMRDHIPPITLVCQYVERHVFETVYGLNLPIPGEGEIPNRSPTAEEVLNAYGYMRGYMTAHGLPDGPRSSRYILKDFVKGKLLYCHPPPDADPVEFQEGHYTSSVLAYQNVEQAVKRKKQVKQPQNPSSVDQEFFKQEDVKVFAKGIHGPTKFTVDGVMIDLSDPKQRALYKPWKKHHNRNKKEKLRRIHKE